MNAKSGESLTMNRRDQMARMFSPRSVAIIGMSTREGTAGHMVLRNFLTNGFAGDVHLVGRTAGEIEGLPIVTDIGAIPENVDVAVLTLPADAVGDTLMACAARQVGTAVVFASGFAEQGIEARQEQERIAAGVRQSGLSVLGPNCIGYTSYLSPFTVGFTNLVQLQKVAPDVQDGVAIVAQSGGLASHLRLGLLARGVAISYNISTGNEMDLSLADFIDYLIDDKATRVIMVYAEHIRQPMAFLAAARRARAAGKPVVMLHSGRGARAQQAAQSHTGALTGDYAVMRLQVERAGVVLVESLDELIDVTEILARYPTPSEGGLGVMTMSGAYCGIAHDFCEDIGVSIPDLREETVQTLKPKMPDYMDAHNPLDLGTQAIWQPELVGIGLQGLLSDPGLGGVAISFPPGSPAKAKSWMEQIIDGRGCSEKPLAVAILGDASPLSPEFIQLARDNNIILGRSSDRMMRAMGHVLKRTASSPDIRISPIASASLPELAPGTLPEWKGKEFLKAAGIATPDGGMTQSVDEAVALASRIGFPIVIKAQASALAHKTEAGGVLLNLTDEAALRTGWKTLMDNISRAQPGLVLDGVLVEAMVGKGIELVVGARRDAQWGPILLIGLGGVLIEALQDVCLLPAEAGKEEIVAGFHRLKTAKLLKGFRNMPAADIDAASEIAAKVGRLMVQQPEILEIDINPLMVHAKGQGATALDALIVVQPQ